MRKLSNLLQVHDSITIPVSELAELLSLCADPLRFCQVQITKSDTININNYLYLQLPQIHRLCTCRQYIHQH